jgi:hypothetical protein
MPESFQPGTTLFHFSIAMALSKLTSRLCEMM